MILKQFQNSHLSAQQKNYLLFQKLTNFDFIEKFEKVYF